MSGDITEAIDDYCEQMYNHTDWAWLSSTNKSELETRSHIIEGDVVIWRDYE